MEKVTRRKSGTYHWKRGRVLLFISALILNRGNFTRGRKRSAPSAFADHIDYHDSGERAAKAHPFMLREAGSVSDSELQLLYGRGWETLRNPAGDLLVGCRAQSCFVQDNAAGRLYTGRGSP